MEFLDLYTKLKRPLPGRPFGLIGLDPGETTGWAYFLLSSDNQFLPRIHLHACGQAKTPTIEDAIPALPYIDTGITDPEAENVHVVIEDYKVYGWKRDQHSWASLHTPKLIGCIQTLCYKSGIDYTMQMAIQGKDFCTDEKLQEWGFYEKGHRHARDAIRHCCSWLLFDKQAPKIFLEGQ